MYLPFVISFTVQAAHCFQSSSSPYMVLPSVDQSVCTGTRFKVTLGLFRY